MIRILDKLPKECIIACSGGADSMAALSFLTNHNKRNVTVAYFDHGTEFGAEAKSFVQDFCQHNNLNLSIGQITEPKSKDESWEEYWRNQRYLFLHSFNLPVITAHNLNDQMENWLFTGFHGQPRLIPYQNRNVIRPFMLALKSELIEWCKSKNIPWLEDPSNQNTNFMRNKIRHDILPEVLKVNPGFDKVIFKKVLELV
jgi:tRNA(Ile)-lysidine synthase